MKDEIIKRTLILTITSLLVFFFITLFVTSNLNRKNLEENLISISTVVNRDISDTTTEGEMAGVVNRYTQDQNYLRIVITNSYGAFIYDSSNDSEDINEKLTDKELSYTEEKLPSDRVYVVGKELFYINKITDDIIVRTSIEIKNETNFVLISAFYMLLLVAVVIMVGIIFIRKTSDMVVDAFRSISNNLKTINKGEYQTIEENNKFEEVNDAIKEINKINESIYTYIKNISHERDKVNFIVDNMEQGLIISRLNGEVRLVNQAAESIFSVSHEEVKTLEDIFSEGDCKRIKNVASNLIFDYYRNDLDRIYEVIASNINRVWKERDEQHLIFISVIDVTEDRKNDEIKAEFISNASHELKTPITSISGFSELLIDSYDSISKEKMENYLNRIHDEALHMKETIDELLYLSNLDNHSLDLSEDVYLDELVMEVYEEYLDKVTKEGLSFTRNVVASKTLGCNNLIKHLIINLVENAIKYNKENGSIDITLEKNEEYTILKVSDTGIGIEEKNIDKIFERFYRVDESRSRKTGGTGIGLPICKKICAAHNTTISVDSKVGVGTVFAVPFRNYE